MLQSRENTIWMRKISFVLHGKVRHKKDLLRQIHAALKDDFELLFYETKKPRHAEILATEALLSGCDYLVAVGGDGTLSEVTNAFLKAGGKGKFETRIGILPWGTGNDFVRSIGMNKSVSQLAGLIETDSFSLIDAGRIDYIDEKGKPAFRYFDNIADIGIGAEVVARVNGVHIRKVILGGTLIFFFTALRTFLFYKHKQVKVEFNDVKWEGRLLSLVVANGKFFGSGLGIAPDAVINDGLFDVVILGDLSVWDYLKNFGRVRASQKLNLPEVQYFTSREVRVETTSHRVIAEADGEVGGMAPLTFTCLQNVIPILKPDN